jgi:anti-sigma factor ChrR (cupin superfamily)
MSFEPTELVLDVDALPWVPMGVGAWGKVLRVCSETGMWTVMFKQEAGSFALPHKHLGPADFYVLQGRIEYRGGVATAGHFAREPLNAVHEKTTFPEETIYLFTSYGPLAMYGPNGEIAGVLDAEALEGLMEPERRGVAGQ